MAVAFATLWGCDKMSLVSPTGSTITLTINKTSVPINGTAEVTAAVIESAGTPVQNGTVVTFTSSFGVIEPLEARTNGGTARVTFTGTQSGVAKIGAFSGGAKTAADLEVKVGTAGAETLRVRAEPPNVPQAGGSSQIIVTVNDVSGGPLPNAPVLFTTDNGSVSPGTSTTDANGEARTTLTTSRTSKVTATVGAKTGDVTVSVVNAPAVTVTGPATATAGLTANFTITPTVPAGGAPIRDVIVNWGDGSAPRNLGPITGATTVSHAYERADSYTVTATATDQIGQQGTGSFSVNVTRVLPTIGITCPTATQNTGVPGSYTVTPPPTSTFPIQNVTVDFGDGTTRNLGQITGPTGFTKTYTTDGGFSVTAVVTDTAGQRGSSSCSVIVTTSKPTVSLSNTSPITANSSEGFTVTATPSGSGSPIASVTVTRSDTGAIVYTGSGSGSFTTTTGASGTTFTLNASATDASGATGTTSFVVNVP
ncbi:MAG: Ig-like domain-containing protein [Acidobacteriota bacterium]|nr:Ig-like domain-containing protein [Acidobacteriota bacterium]